MMPEKTKNTWFSDFLQRRSTIGWAIFIFTILTLVVTAPNIGLTWDEPAYIAASESYQAWLKLAFTQPVEAFSPEQIEFYWNANHEHPPLDKIWSGLIWDLGRHFFDHLVAHRLGNMLLVAIMAALLYLLVSEKYGDFAGLGAAAALLAMPRFFFHAHLAALDVPVAFMVFLITYLFWKSADSDSWKWTLLLGTVWGAALATKVNAFFILPTLFLWVVLVRRQVNLASRIVVMGVIGVPLFILLWPWLYHNTAERLIDYIKFITVDHWELGIFYLGEYFMPPPWHYAFVITWAIIPLGLMLCTFLGAGLSIRTSKQNQGFGWLLLISAIVPLAALSTGKSMVYDGERLFIPTIPFLAALAGIGLNHLAQQILKLLEIWKLPVKKTWLNTLVMILVYAGPIWTIVQMYPHLLSYYSFNVGGLPGATKLGFETTYWCESYLPAVVYINEHANPGDKVWVEPWSHDVLVYFKLHGQMRQDIQIVYYRSPWISSVFGDIRDYGIPGNYHNADFVIFQNRQTQFYREFEPITTTWLNNFKPVYEIGFKGVPIVMVFDLR